MTKQQKRKILEAAAVGAALLAGASGLSRSSRRRMARELAGHGSGCRKMLSKAAVAVSFGALMYVKSRMILR